MFYSIRPYMAIKVAIIYCTAHIICGTIMARANVTDITTPLPAFKVEKARQYDIELFLASNRVTQGRQLAKVELFSMIVTLSPLEAGNDGGRNAEIKIDNITRPALSDRDGDNPIEAAPIDPETLAHLKSVRLVLRSNDDGSLRYDVPKHLEPLFEPIVKALTYRLPVNLKPGDRLGDGELGEYGHVSSRTGHDGRKQAVVRLSQQGDNDTWIQIHTVVDVEGGHVVRSEYRSVRMYMRPGWTDERIREEIAKVGPLPDGWFDHKRHATLEVINIVCRATLRTTNQPVHGDPKNDER